VTLVDIPAVTISSPLSQTITTEQSITVAGTVSRPPTSVTINGVAASVSGASFSALVPLREGDNMLTATAIDVGGGTASDSVEVTRDNISPVIVIQTPSNGLRSANGSITVAGFVNDIVSGGLEPAVSVNGVSAAVANGAFVVTGLPLVRGPNTIVAQARDAAGNVGRNSITVTLEQVAGARMTLNSGDTQTAQASARLPQPLSVRIVDQAGNPVAGRLVRFEVSRNNGLLIPAGSTQLSAPATKIVASALGERKAAALAAASSGSRMITVPTNGDGVAEASLLLGDSAGAGNNRVKATAVGVAGEVEFCATAEAEAADRVIATLGLSQRAAVGQAVPQPLEVMVVDRQGNAVEGADVKFAVTAGGGTIDGFPVVTRKTNGAGVARSMLTLGLDAGINNNIVTASIEGLTSLPATFVASAFKTGSAASTTFSGVVLDNALTPIPGARIFIPGTSAEGLTGDDGRFVLTGVPVGLIQLHVDPARTTRAEKFPALEFETTTIAGIENQLGQPILLPPIDLANAKIVGGAQDVVLTMANVPGLELKIFANSVTFPDGARTGSASISQVHSDKVPMQPPNGTIFLPPAWSIKPAGARFDPPAQITIPNNGLAPGTVIDIFQFDHELFKFVSIGQGSVSTDGSVIVSDPGFGITRAAWGGGGPPPPPNTGFDLPIELPPIRRPPLDPRCQASLPGGTCPGGLMRRDNGFREPPNGCTIVPALPSGVDFTPACNNHDNCYGTFGANKFDCDANFTGDMRSACVNSPLRFVPGILPLCLSIAGYYGLGVISVGGRFYDAAQQAVTECCPI